MKVLVLGGDGFCGWPTSLHLSRSGHEVVIVDNLSRRKIDIDLECESLTPISSIGERIDAWEEVSGKTLGFENIDVSLEYDKLLSLICEFKPDSIVHFAEQRAAPYSMKNSKTKRYTVNNNLGATNNVCCAIVESGFDIHLVHLGTMGVYGYKTAGVRIPEGYLNVRIEKEHYICDEDNSPAGDILTEILYPADPGSIYHMTKTQDALFFYFFNKNDGLKITDLHQGVVWGTSTDETAMDERLINRFDYDSDYGTVLNRFLMQAAIDYPLTVYGEGGQTRAFIHIRDTVKCIQLAITTPPNKNERVRIINQMTETHTVLELAQKISKVCSVHINKIKNPRKEALKNDLVVDNEVFLNMGLNPTTLSDGLMLEINEIAKKYSGRCDIKRIVPSSFW